MDGFYPNLGLCEAKKEKWWGDGEVLRSGLARPTHGRGRRGWCCSDAGIKVQTAALFSPSVPLGVAAETLVFETGVMAEGREEPGR